MTDLQKATVTAIVNVFETGRVRGDYGAIAVLKGDSGHLSYGRSQTTLGSGNLYQMLDLYCKQSGAKFASELSPFLLRFQRRDFSLDTDSDLRSLLKRAAQEDSVMRVTQDQFFNSMYFAPAARAAAGCGITLPLGLAIVYDSHIQGGWDRLKTRVGAVVATGEQAWLQRYVDERRKWLMGLKPPLPSTTYRMAAFSTLITDGAWNLPMPLRVHGVVITEESLMSGDKPLAGVAKRTLRVASPYLRGEDVTALQQALKAKGIDNALDGVYGALTQTLVKKWQVQNGIQEDGAGPATLTSLGIAN